jgi:HD-like signal output (HDOD) protein
MVDDSLAAGLLHDIGKLILASSLPEQFGRVAAQASGDHLEAEREAFGATHADVGGYLLGLWGLPGAVVEAVNLHHSPRESQTNGFTALTATHVANCLIHEQFSEGEAALRAAPDMEYINQLGLAERLPLWRLAVEDCLRAPNNHFEYWQ